MRTMKANYRIEAGDVSVIRPLLYVREHQTKEFARGATAGDKGLPACFEEPKEQHRVKKMLAREEASPDVRQHENVAPALMGEGIDPYMDLGRRSVDLNQQARRAPGQNPTPGAAKRARLLDAPAESSATGGTTATAAAAATAATTAAVTAATAATAEETVKWGSEVLAVLPDSWLEEVRAAREKTPGGGGGGGGQSSTLGWRRTPTGPKSRHPRSRKRSHRGRWKPRPSTCGKANGKCG